MGYNRNNVTFSISITGIGDGRTSVSFRTDGVWLWLDDLDYYVSECGLRLPDSFVKHMEEVCFHLPSEHNFDLQKLSWPPII